MGRGSCGVGSRRLWRRWRWGGLGVGVDMRDQGPEEGLGRGGLCRLRPGEFSGLLYFLLLYTCIEFSGCHWSLLEQLRLLSNCLGCVLTVNQFR